MWCDFKKNLRVSTSSGKVKSELFLYGLGDSCNFTWAGNLLRAKLTIELHLGIITNLVNKSSTLLSSMIQSNWCSTLLVFMTALVIRPTFSTLFFTSNPSSYSVKLSSPLGFFNHRLISVSCSIIPVLPQDHRRREASGIMARLSGMT